MPLCPVIVQVYSFEAQYKKAADEADRNIKSDM